MEVSGKRNSSVERIAPSEADALCELCKGDNVSSQANGFCKECEEMMCHACFKKHLRLKACQNHTLLDTTASSKMAIRRSLVKVKCKYHGKETVKYYCRKHEAVGCGDCLVSKHGGCKTEFIKDLSANLQQTEEYRTFMKQIEEVISEGKEFDKRIQENKQGNKLMLEKALKDIKQFRQDINKYLDKAEQDINSQVKDIMEENETLLTQLEKDCTTLSNKLKGITDMLNSELYKDNVLFIHTIECKPKFAKSEEAFSGLKSKSTTKYEFVRGEQLRSLVSSAQKLGTVEISSSAIYPQTSDRAKGKSKGSARGNTEGNEMEHIRPLAFPGGFKQEEAGVRPVVAIGARVRRNGSFRSFRRGGVDYELLPRYEYGTVTAVHGDGMVTVRWDVGREGRHRIGKGPGDVTLLQS